MITQIGQSAGKVWSLLGQKGQVNVVQLPKSLKEKSAVVYQSLGWLARENKIQYTSKSGKTYVSLTPMEQNAYQVINTTKE